jgi:hypothetical protein
MSVEQLDLFPKRLLNQKRGVMERGDREVKVSFLESSSVAVDQK